MKTLMKTRQNMFPAIPSLLNSFLQDDWLDSTLGSQRTGTTTLPAANIRETENDFRIELAAPGMRKEDFRVELNNDVLTVAAEQEMKNENKEGDYTRREFSYQSLQRSFTLPDDRVKGEQITARYQDGVLEIVVPKRQEAKAKSVRQIAIS
jgi:HSP20 family protein